MIPDASKLTVRARVSRFMKKKNYSEPITNLQPPERRREIP
jgi:hypothetical protein